MRILMLTNTFTPHVGGVARSVEGFTAEYRRLGHEVLVVAPEFPDMSANETGVVRIRAIQHFNGSDFSFPVPVPQGLQTALDNFEPEIIHSHHPFLLGDSALRIGAERGLPVVFTHHTLYEQYTHYVPGDSPGMQRGVIELAVGYCNLCQAVIAPSESIEGLLRQRGVVSPIHVIPTGVETQVFATGDGTALRMELGIPQDCPVLGHVGRLAPEKNLPRLAEAVARVLDRHSTAHFIVAGDGPCRADIERIFAECGLTERLHLLGVLERKRLADTYAAMDVFVFASTSETQGMVLTEAMAAGVPVVAADAPGVREVVQDGVNGLLLPRAEPDALVAGLETWLAADTDRERWSAGARATADRLSMSQTARRALELYSSLIGRRQAQEADTAWQAARRRVAEEWRIWKNLVHATQVWTQLSRDDD